LSSFRLNCTVSTLGGRAIVLTLCEKLIYLIIAHNSSKGKPY